MKFSFSGLVTIGFFLVSAVSYADHADTTCFTQGCEMQRTQEQDSEIMDIAARLIYQRDRLVGITKGVENEYHIAQAIKDYTVLLKEFNDSYQHYLNNKTWKFSLEKVGVAQRQSFAFNPYAFALLSGLVKINGGMDIKSVSNRHQLEFYESTFKSFQNEEQRFIDLLAKTEKEAPAVTNMFNVKKVDGKAYQIGNKQLEFYYVSDLEAQDKMTYGVLKPFATIFGVGDHVSLAKNATTEILPTLDYKGPQSSDSTQPKPEEIVPKIQTNTPSASGSLANAH